MYTDEDLNNAVSEKIFTRESVEQFRLMFAESRETPLVDEENFRLLSGFNDIFVVIACLLLLISSLWVFQGIDQRLSLTFFTVVSWGLAEFFVRKRKLALPAIVLLVSFVGGIFALSVSLFGVSWNDLEDTKFVLMASTAIAVVAAFVHWKRFMVPITIAAGTVFFVGFLLVLFMATFPEARQWLHVIIFLLGILVFLFAMCWDASDVKRMTRRSDVAFWLHLLSAPLIIHPVFSLLGVFGGDESVMSMLLVLALYIVMTVISLVVDRRAFMVSSLSYVLYALTTLFEAYGVIGHSFAVTGVVIGTVLLLLSASWHWVRQKLLIVMPAVILQYVP